MNWTRDEGGLGEADLEKVFKYEPRETTVIRILARDGVSNLPSRVGKILRENSGKQKYTLSKAIKSGVTGCTAYVFPEGGPPRPESRAKYYFLLRNSLL